MAWAMRACRNGEFDLARAHFERGLANARAAGDAWSEALFLFHLGFLVTSQGDPVGALAPGREALARARELGNPWCIAYAAMLLGLSLAEAGPDGGDPAAAEALVREALVLQRRLRDTFGIGHSLLYLALTAAARQPVRALRLAGASLRLLEVAGYRRTPAHREWSERRLRPVRQALSEPFQAAAWAEGRAMSPQEAVDYALAPDAAPASAPAAGAPAGDLTVREREVAALVAQGLTNRQIGDALVISEGTARVHVAHVLAKLGFHSRVQVAAWAAAHGVLAPAAEDAPAPSA